jgi:AhpD family alkylhydroperoxidase
MERRLNARELSPKGMKAIAALHAFVHECGLEVSLLELVKLRVSQINGCAYCIDMHAKKLRDGGESEQRIYLLNAWREAPQYTSRERAALQWAETITLLATRPPSDSDYESVRREFEEADVVNLTLAVVAINGANRLNVAFRTSPTG